MRKSAVVAVALAAVVAMGGCGAQLSEAPEPIAETQNNMTTEEKDKAVQIAAFLKDPTMRKAKYCYDTYQDMIEIFNDKNYDGDKTQDLSNYRDRISEAAEAISSVDADKLPDYLKGGYVWLNGSAGNYKLAADDLVEADNLFSAGSTDEANAKVKDANMLSGVALEGLDDAREHFKKELMGDF